MLLIGGFTISSALSKTNIDRVLITRILNLAGTNPSVVLLAFMGVSCFASMWIRCEMDSARRWFIRLTFHRFEQQCRSSHFMLRLDQSEYILVYYSVFS